MWVVARGLWVGFTGRGSRSRVLWPTWILLAATVFLAGFRIGLNVEASNVIDVGYSGVIGAERIVSEGEAPWGNFPIEGTLPACGPADSSGEIRDHIQTNGRCESANPQGDTYGPTAYEAYIPGYLIRGWSGKWDDLPAVHLTSILFDVLTMIGLWLVGRRFGGARLAACSRSHGRRIRSRSTRRARTPTTRSCRAFSCTASGSRRLRSGAACFGALSGWSKFASLIVMPLWATYPDRRPSGRFLVAFAAATLAAFSIVLPRAAPLHELRVFWDRTIAWQDGRALAVLALGLAAVPRAGLPDLHILQRVLQGALVLGAIAFAWFPRRKSPLQLAALTAALLAGFELVQTYWLYTYIPWFFPFAAIAAFAPAAFAPAAFARAPTRSEEPDYRAWPFVPSAG